MKEFNEYLKKVMSFEDLTEEEAYSVMNKIMTGEAGEIRTAGMLVALAMKKETGQEIEGFAKAMRKAAVRWPSRERYNILDTCGTGGDNANLLNISTITAVVMATLGYKVAKHGNRAVSSATGSADVLEECGINIEISNEEAAECLEKVGITFLCLCSQMASSDEVCSSCSKDTWCKNCIQYLRTNYKSSTSYASDYLIEIEPPNL
jgi:anthranilate phosphoribosyltransferase